MCACASSVLISRYTSPQQGSCLLCQWCFWSTRHGKEHRGPAQQSFWSLSSGLHWEGKCQKAAAANGKKKHNKKQKKNKKGHEEEMWQMWVTSSQIHSLYKVNIQLLFLFLRRLNIMSDTLRSSRSRSRTSSSWFHNLRRSCWRPGNRQVGERPLALCSHSRRTVTRWPAASRLAFEQRFPTWLNHCGLLLFWPLRRHEVRVPQPSIQWGQRIQENAVPGMCRVCCVCSEIAIWGPKKKRKQLLVLKLENTSERGHSFLLNAPRSAASHATSNMVIVVVDEDAH